MTSRKPKPEPLLWNRGRTFGLQNWYLRLPIPKPLRSRFRNKLSIIRPLHTGDLAVARRKRDELVVRCRRIFDRLSAGEPMTDEQIEIALALDLNHIEEQSKFLTVQLFPRYFRHDLAKLYQAPPDNEILQLNCEAVAKDLGLSLPLNSEVQESIKAALVRGYQAGIDKVQTNLESLLTTHYHETVQTKLEGQPPSPISTGETINQAAEAWFQHIQSDPSATTRQLTLDGHRQRVRTFIEHVGDIPLAKVDRAMAFDFLTKIATAGKLSNSTWNNYYQTLFGIFNLARLRGRFTGENPFAELSRKAVRKSFEPFTIPELQKLFDAFQFEVKPNKYSTVTALPWISLIALFTGMRQEEICQLKAADIRNQPDNGAIFTVIDIHNGGTNNLKNESSVRLVPVHSQLVRAGLLQYRDALPQGSPLFPGLRPRKSKGNKIGPRISELFGKKLIALGIKRKGLCFHSLRHNVTGQLDAAELRQTDVARVLGHKIEEVTFGTYSKKGPGLKTLAAVVEKIEYPGLVILPAKDC